MSPFVNKKDLYFDNSSPMLGISFNDITKKVNIPFTNCTTYPVQMYLPINNYNIQPQINDYRTLLDPSNQHKTDSLFYSQPFYISPEGVVTNETISMRIDKYFVPFNFSCNYYSDANIAFEQLGCEYKNFTINNYILCECKHLTEFVARQFEIPKLFYVEGRFFYLKYFVVLTNKDNFKTNFAFFCTVSIIGVWLLVVIFYTICDCVVMKKSNILDYLKMAIVKMNMPYRRFYNLNLGISMPTDALTRIKKGIVKQKKKLYSKTKKKGGEKKNVKKDDSSDEMADIELISVEKKPLEGPLSVEKLNDLAVNQKKEMDYKTRKTINFLSMDPDLMDFDNVNINAGALKKLNHVDGDEEKEQEMFEQALAGNNTEEVDLKKKKDKTLAKREKFYKPTEDDFNPKKIPVLTIMDTGGTGENENPTDPKNAFDDRKKEIEVKKKVDNFLISNMYKTTKNRADTGEADNDNDNDQDNFEENEEDEVEENNDQIEGVAGMIFY